MKILRYSRSIVRKEASDGGDGNNLVAWYCCWLLWVSHHATLFENINGGGDAVSDGNQSTYLPHLKVFIYLHPLRAFDGKHEEMVTRWSWTAVLMTVVCDIGRTS